MKLHNTKEPLEVTVSKLSGSSFVDVNMSGASFEDVNMSNCRMHDINLTGLTISDANLTDATISQAKFSGMKIDGILVTELLRVYRTAVAD
jgi:uncharacterized protein YjbI with pentapeptide repeats